MDIVVAKDFSAEPAGRYEADGPFSGEVFRDRLLVPSLRKGGEVKVHLDGTEGYGSSFLEEAFGGLVRVSGFSRAFLAKNLILVSKDRLLILEITAYLDDAAQKIAG